MNPIVLLGLISRAADREREAVIKWAGSHTRTAHRPPQRPTLTHTLVYAHLILLCSLGFLSVYQMGPGSPRGDNTVTRHCTACCHVFNPHPQRILNVKQQITMCLSKQKSLLSVNKNNQLQQIIIKNRTILP